MASSDELSSLAPQDLQATWCATLVDEWVRSGVTDAVIAPGSRSTPLALALTGDGRLRCRVVLDERSAGFLALGIGMASGSPAIVVCTSGTAAVELHPAVVEAGLAGVPMLVATADRPPDLHTIGAPQTVDQQRLYGPATRWYHDPGVPGAATAWAWRSIAARAVAEARDGVAGPGPVHLNLPFREPLVGRPSALPAGRAGGAPWHRREGRAGDAVLQAIGGVGALVGRRGVIVAGGGAGDDVGAVLRLASVLGWPVLADPRSGCRVADAAVVGAADAILRRADRAARLHPEVIVRLGAPPASKVLAQWLGDADAFDVLVDPVGSWPDPGRTASVVLGCDPALFCRAVAGAVDDRPGPVAAAWAARWQAAERAAQRAIDEVIARRPGSEPAVARLLLAGLPDGAALVVSSSMPVRDVEWYGAPRGGVRVLGNRGANGIDGVTSTVLGVAAAHDGPVVGLLGDLALLHDASGLVTAANAGIDATLVVVDNGGGGIFEFLPQATALDRGRYEQLFGTRQTVDVIDVVAGFGLGVIEAVDAPAVVEAVRKSIDTHTHTPGVRVVVVRTDRRDNVAIHDEIHAAVDAAIDASGTT